MVIDGKNYQIIINKSLKRTQFFSESFLVGIKHSVSNDEISGVYGNGLYYHFLPLFPEICKFHNFTFFVQSIPFCNVNDNGGLNARTRYKRPIRPYNGLLRSSRKSYRKGQKALKRLYFGVYDVAHVPDTALTFCTKTRCNLCAISQ